VTYLTSETRHAHDYWLFTHYADHHLVLIDILDIVACNGPQPMQIHPGVVKGNQSFFTCMTQWSFENLLAAGAYQTHSQPHRDFLTVLTHWSNVYGLDLVKHMNSNGDVEITACMLMPIAHGILCVTRHWSSWAFPYLTERQRRGHAYHLGSDLWNGYSEGDAMHYTDVDVDPFDPSDFMGVTDCMRRCLLQLAPIGNDALREEMNSYISQFQTIRNNCLLHQACMTRKAYDFKMLVSVVILSGLLRDSADTGEAIDLALDVCIPDKSLKMYFKQLRQRHKNRLSKTTIIRHRLTLTLAYSALYQELNDEMMSDGPVVSWRTLDLSPQAGYEWLMHGCSIIRQSELVPSLELVRLLMTPLAPNDERDIQVELAGLFEIAQGVPSAVGSGRSGLKYKVHACFHSERFRVKSWQAVARIMNSSVTWVGDLGETKVSTVRCNLKTFVGPWVDDDYACDVVNDFVFEDEITHRGDNMGDPRAAPAHPSDYPYPEDPYDVDMTKTVYISGPHHVLHNMTESFHSVLALWWSGAEEYDGKSMEKLGGAPC
jgi:hypothetical protein